MRFNEKINSSFAPVFNESQFELPTKEVSVKFYHQFLLHLDKPFHLGNMTPYSHFNEILDMNYI
jgi:hypothetical protein